MTNINNNYCVIIAGGKGRRLWPCSRRFDPGSGYKEAAKCYYYNAWLLFLSPTPLSLVVL